MMDGKMEGLFVMGQNPAVAGPNAGMERRALAKLKWLVVREMVETETASFWYDSPEVQARRNAAGGNPNGSLPHAGRGSRGKRRHIHQYAATVAMARESGRSSRR